MKKCKINKYFMAGDMAFEIGAVQNFEPETAAALEDAGLIEILGDAEKPKRGEK